MPAKHAEAMEIVHGIMLEALELVKHTIPAFARHNNMTGSNKLKKIYPTEVSSLYREMGVKFARARPLPQFGNTPTFFKRVKEKGWTVREKAGLRDDREVVGPRPGGPTPEELAAQGMKADRGLSGEIGRGPEEEEEVAVAVVEGTATVVVATPAAKQRRSEASSSRAGASDSSARKHLSGGAALALSRCVIEWDAGQPKSRKRRATMPWSALAAVCGEHGLDEQRARVWVQDYRAGRRDKALSAGGSLSGTSMDGPPQAGSRRRRLELQAATSRAAVTVSAAGVGGVAAALRSRKQGGGGGRFMAGGTEKRKSVETPAEAPAPKRKGKGARSSWTEVYLDNKLLPPA